MKTRTHTGLQKKTIAILLGSLALAACGQQETTTAATEPATTATAVTPAATTTGAIKGRVASTAGAEAGVWVIAETRDLPTRFARTVVTNDNGEYVIPDLPAANYDVWVRGYGLVDSAKVSSTVGATLDLTAVVAPDAAAAAEYYPAGYWFSLLEVPDASQFPGTAENGIHPNVKQQADFIRLIGSGGCVVCHQLGNKATRTIPALFSGYDSSDAAWARRIQSGQAGGFMTRTLTSMGLPATTKMFGNWTDRVAAGELPPVPQRPAGAERNVVITQWDWADPTAYLHDVVSTDRRNPTVNGYGKLYGSLEESHDYLPVLDPVTNEISRVPLTMMDPAAEPVPGPQVAESPYFGTENIWDSKANVHNPMFDQDGKLWITARVRGRDNPAFCQAGSTHPSAVAFPLEGNGRQLGIYDPATGAWTATGSLVTLRTQHTATL
ncbi:MAG: carboxypeptidase-like regulatory domain-containing protein, partial [Pseudomonadota bacterium]